MNLFIVDMILSGVRSLIKNLQLPSWHYYRDLAEAFDDIILEWIPLWILSWVKLDVWYATDILEWEFDYMYSKSDPNDYHFHLPGNGGWVVRPVDYRHPYIRRNKIVIPQLH